jgi:hypothetical protein
MSEVAESKVGWNFRLAEPADGPAFSKWAAENPQIEEKDLLATLKKNNPTVLFFTATKDGMPVSFAPVYCQLSVAHLAFNPEALAQDKLRALEVLIDGVDAFAVSMGIREVVTLSKPEYGVAQWAMKHGFDLEERQVFKRNINKILEQAQKEEAEANKLCAPVAEA